MVQVPQDELESAGRGLIGFSWGLRDHLREQAELAELPGFEECEDATAHIPVYLIDRQYGLLRRWKEKGWIDGADQRVIDADLRRLHELAGRCESIRLTRIASSYRVFVRQCILVFLLTFPWGMSTQFSWWTIPLTAITAYFMLGLEIVAEHVEEPFGHDEDDLDLDRLCESVSDTVNESLIRARSE
jgi:putative membrane protein